MRPLTSILLAIFILAGCATTQSPPQPPHENLVFPEAKSFTAPDIDRFTFNGTEFFLLQDPELPLVTVTVLIDGGSWMEPAEKTGLASLAGTVLRSGGSADYPEEELNELLERRAASMETSFGLTTGSARMNVLREDFGEMLPVFTGLLKNPLFPQERLDLAKTQQRTAISRRNDEASSVATREFRKLIYGPESVYARTTEYATLDHITRDDLVDFHSRVMHGSNMLVGVVGDFDPAVIREQLTAAFGTFDEGEPVDSDLPGVDYDFEPGLFFAHKGDMNQSQIRMGHIGGYRDNPDYAALQVMNQILSGGFSGRLFREVRTDQGLAYGVYGTYSSNVRYPGVFFAGLSTAAENTHEALEATIYQIRRLQDEPVSQQELDETKERIFNRIIFRYDSYARILGERLNNYNLGLPEDAFDQYIEEVRLVTTEDIQRVANTYLQPDNMKILIVGNRDLIDDQLAAIGTFRDIDIAIPRPGAERPAMELDTEAGRAWLDRMSGAILTGFSRDQTLVMAGTQYVQTPQGEMPLQVESQTRFPDALTLELNTPMGTQVLEISDGTGVVRMGTMEQSLPPQAVNPILQGLMRDPVHIALAANDISAGLNTAESTEDKVVLYLDGDFDLTLELDPETALPRSVTYQEFDATAGREVDVTIRYDDWTAGSGLLVPYSQKQFSNGDAASRSVYTSHSVK